MKKIYIIIIICLSFLPFNINAMTKTETVYSILNNDGSVKKTTINTKLTNLEKGDITDYTNLENIKNINGNQEFTKDSTKLTWKSTGKDIYYQGILNDNLPIKVNVKYYLNGEEIKPNKLKGKSGSIKIIFSLTNSDYNYDYGVKVPYVVNLTSILSNKNASNINITNGKTVSMEGKTICTAIASPGLYESTNIDEFNSLDSITLTYDTTKYEQTDFYFVITPKLLSDLDLKSLDKVNTKLSDLNKLNEGTNALKEGSNTLYNGEVEFNDGLNKLNEGINSALNGSKEITNGLQIINNNTTSISSLTTMIDRLYETYNNNLNLLQGIESGQTETELKEGIINATNEKTNLETTLSNINAHIAELEQGEAAGLLNEEQLEQLNNLRYQKEQVEAGIQKYEEGIAEAQANLAMLPVAKYKILGANEVITQVLCGILNTSDISNINDETITMFKNNISKLVGGINTLYNGSNTLSNGLQELYDGSNKLVEGNKRIEEGTKSLSEGIEKLQNEGISKIVNLGSKVKSYTYKINNYTKASKNYSGYASNNADNTIFIYKISKS